MNVYKFFIGFSIFAIATLASKGQLIAFLPSEMSLLHPPVSAIEDFVGNMVFQIAGFVVMILAFVKKKS